MAEPVDEFPGSAAGLGEVVIEDGEVFHDGFATTEGFEAADAGTEIEREPAPSGFEDGDGGEAAVEAEGGRFL